VQAQQPYSRRQVLLYRDSVIDVQELSGNQPNGKPALLKPGVGEKKELTVKASQAADSDTKALAHEILEAFRLSPFKVMMANVGRIGNQEVVSLPWRRLLEEVSLRHGKPGFVP
jgi:hypothetical protein